MPFNVVFSTSPPAVELMDTVIRIHDTPALFAMHQYIPGEFWWDMRSYRCLMPLLVYIWAITWGRSSWINLNLHAHQTVCLWVYPARMFMSRTESSNWHAYADQNWWLFWRKTIANIHLNNTKSSSSTRIICDMLSISSWFSHELPSCVNVDFTASMKVSHRSHKSPASKHWPSDALKIMFNNHELVDWPSIHFLIMSVKWYTDSTFWSIRETVLPAVSINSHWTSFSQRLYRFQLPCQFPRHWVDRQTAKLHHRSIGQNRRGQRDCPSTESFEAKMDVDHLAVLGVEHDWLQVRAILLSISLDMFNSKPSRTLWNWCRISSSSSSLVFIVLLFRELQISIHSFQSFITRTSNITFFTNTSRQYRERYTTNFTFQAQTTIDHMIPLSLYVNCWILCRKLCQPAIWWSCSRALIAAVHSLCLCPLTRASWIVSNPCGSRIKR